MNREEIISKLKKLIDGKRLKHSIGVSRCAAELAARYGIDAEKAEIAGLVHDCAKNLPYDEMIKLCSRYGFEPDNISKTNKALIHAPLGAYMANDIFGISDREIIDAIACHTTGKTGMTTFEKILCLADYIEPERQYPGVDEIRALAVTDINRALLKALELSIRNVMERGKLLHPMTVDARNYLLTEIESTNKTETKASLKSL